MKKAIMILLNPDDEDVTDQYQLNCLFYRFRPVTFCFPVLKSRVTL